MRVLIACECSGIVRAAFRARGHGAWSCDLLPSEDHSPHHFQCDVRELLRGDVRHWDLLIAHPPCDYLATCAAWAFADPDFKRYAPPLDGYHQKVKTSTLTGAARRAAREEALAFVRFLMDAPVPHICIENPVGVISTRIRRPDQIIQPWMFGDDASKGTCLWLKGLPKLVPNPSVEVPPRWVCKTCGRVAGKSRESYGVIQCAGCGCTCAPRWANQTNSGQNNLSPGDNRQHDRARTYPGIADAMAQQWSILCQEANESVLSTPTAPASDPTTPKTTDGDLSRKTESSGEYVLCEPDPELLMRALARTR